MWYERSFRMSFCASAKTTPYTAIAPPMRAIASTAGEVRARRYTPAFVVYTLRKTLAAMWGRGYVSGSHVWSGMNPTFTPAPRAGRRGRTGAAHGPQQEASGFDDLQGEAAREEGAPEHVKQEVAIPCADRGAPVLKDEQRGRERHPLPEDEKGNHIAREHGSEARPCVQQGIQVEPGSRERGRI